LTQLDEEKGFMQLIPENLDKGLVFFGGVIVVAMKYWRMTW